MILIASSLELSRYLKGSEINPKKELCEKTRPTKVFYLREDSSGIL